MTNLSNAELEQALRNADAAGDKQAASALAAEWQKRQTSPVASSLAQATNVPESQGFMEDSGLNALGRGVKENIGGGAGGAIGGAIGLKGGSALGTALGGPGIGTGVGGAIGGIGGGILGAMFGNEAQQAVFPTSQQQQQVLAADAENHPVMSFLGQTAPYLATLKPSLGNVRTALTPINAGMSALEKEAIIGSRVGTALGAGLGGASEVVMPMIQGQDVDPTRALLATVLGGLFNEPNRLGRSIGLPTTPTLAQARAKQMAASLPEVPTSNALVVRQPEAPLIQTDVIGPRAVAAPETGFTMPPDVEVRYTPPKALPGEAPLPQLPASAESGSDHIMPRMRAEQAADIQGQVDRLKARRDAMKQNGESPSVLRQMDEQIKRRESALKGLNKGETIIAPEVKPQAPEIIEKGVATPPVERSVPAPEVTPPVDPRMAARTSGADVIGRGERPAFISADAINQAQLADDAARKSPMGASALADDLAAREAASTAKPEVVKTIPEDIARARELHAKPGPEFEPDMVNTKIGPLEHHPSTMSSDDFRSWFSGTNPHDAVRPWTSREISRTASIDKRWSLVKLKVENYLDSAPGSKSSAKKGTPIVAAFKRGDFEILDGQHRYSEANQRGDDYIHAYVPESQVADIEADGLIHHENVSRPVPSAEANAEVVPNRAEALPAEEPAVVRDTSVPNDSAEPTPATGDSPEVASLRKQIAKLDEDIFNAHEDGDSYGAQGLEASRRKVQAKLDEALNPTMSKSLGDRIRAKKVDLVKGQMSSVIAGLTDNDLRRAWNGALEIAARAADAGVHIKEAVKRAAAWVRSNFPASRFKDEEFHKALAADVVADLPGARGAAVREAGEVAGAAMDANPDQFFAGADSTPVKNYVSDVDKMAKDFGHDLMSGRAARSVWQKIKDLNRNFLRGNQAALDDLAKGGSESGRKSPALEKLDGAINGTRPGAEGVGKRGIWDEVITRTKARTNELNEAYNGIKATVDNLSTAEQEGFMSTLVKWMQRDDYATHLQNQPELRKAVEVFRKVRKDMLKDLKDAGIKIGDAGEKSFSRIFNPDVVRRHYDEFVDQFTEHYDKQWAQNDPKYVSDKVKAREAAKALADATIMGHDGIALDGSDLNLANKKTGDADFFKARTFTGAVSDDVDRVSAKFYKRNPFQVLADQINRVERRIGLAKAFGKVDAVTGELDPTAKWREFSEAAIKEGNESIIPEVRERYQMMFGLTGDFNPKTKAFQQAVRNLGYYAYLPFSGINSLTEPTVLAMRLNKPFTGLMQAYGKSFRSMARQIKNAPLDYKEKLADALGLAENATMRAALSLGKIDDQGLLTDKNLAKYFFLTGNSIVSNATSNAAVDIGMSAIRTTLLDFEHGVNKNTARIWLEELGIKKDDFDAVSKWLEGHATDADRFNSVLNGSAEANIVRNAISKFTREARSLPDAGTKNLHSSNTFGAMLLSLQSYLYDFSDKVMGRNIRQFALGAKGETHFAGELNPTKLSNEDRVRLMAPMMLGMPALVAANYGIALARETLYPDPEKIRRDRERTNGEINWNRFTRSLTRSNMMGPYDMLFNMFTQARYEKDVAASALGPYMGGMLELLKSGIALGSDRNSDNTNTAERKFVRNAWNVGPKPLINLALSSMPATRNLLPVAAGGIQMASQRSVAEGAVDMLAGKQQSSGGGRKKPQSVP